MKVSDIKEIVHLIDTDGAFVPENCVKQNLKSETEYTETEILAKDKIFIIKRNFRKSAVLRNLSSTHHIVSINYRDYYLSRTLKPVLHNKIENHSKKFLTFIDF